MTRSQLKELIKEAIRLQLNGSSIGDLDEGMLDRIKAKAKGAVAGVKGAAGAVKDKISGKGDPKQSMTQAVKKGVKGKGQNAQLKQVTGTYLEKISNELNSFHQDLKKAFSLESQNYEQFVKELNQYDPDTAKLAANIYKVSKSLTDKMKDSA